MCQNRRHTVVYLQMIRRRGTKLARSFAVGWMDHLRVDVTKKNCSYLGSALSRHYCVTVRFNIGTCGICVFDVYTNT